MSIDDPKQLRFAAVVGTTWNVLMGAGAVLIGLVGRVYFTGVEALPAADPENLYPTLAQAHLHPVLFGIVVASVFAAIMSTADSQLLVAASAVVRDVYESVLKRGQEIPQARLVRMSRGVVFALVAIALVLGVVAESLVFWLVLFAWAGLGAALGPTSILALYWRRTTRAGVFAGLVTGTLTTIVWYLTPALKDRLYELVPAFTLGLLATVLVSAVTRPPEGVDEMFEAMGVGE
jgi:Na+/proline symporter